VRNRDGIRSIDSVRFSRRNLVDGPGMAQEGRFDIVFCRNVLIYFDEVWPRHRKPPGRRAEKRVFAASRREASSK
jgi:hypothetical protein